MTQRHGRATAGGWRGRGAAAALLSVAGLAAAPGTPARAQSGEAPSPPVLEETHADPSQEEAPDLDEMGIGDELLLFADVPIVVSATRRPQQRNLSSAPISVVSSADLHFSGLTNVAEALTFTPGVDVAMLDRNRIAVGVRGHHDAASDRTLTLVDGRNASDAAFGTSLLMRLPIFIEDVDRVEVVRGPGGAAWGANAFNGVINIIMKEPEATPGTLISGRLNEFGDYDTQFRWGDSAGDWSWRLSAGGGAHESSEDAIDGDNFRSNDAGRNARINAEAVKSIEDGTLRAGLAYGHFEEGDFELALRQPFGEGQTQVARAFARLDREFDGGGSGHVQWYTNFLKADEPSFQERQTLENDLEAQLNFAERAGHSVTIGGNVRHVYANAVAPDEQDFMLRGDAFNDFWVGAFILDRWQARDRLIVESQARVDYYTETGADWSGRLSALFSLDDESRHVVRLSAAKAFRAPLRGFTDGSFQGGPLPPPAPPGTFAVTLLPAEDLDNEQIYSLEAGYTATLTDHLQFRADAYYQRLTDLIGVRTLSSNGPVGVFRFDNIDGADALGVEAELSLTRDNFTGSVWYAYNDLQTDQTNQDIRSFFPAEHKAGASARLSVGDQVTLNLNYRYNDATADGPDTRSIPVNHRADFTIAHALDGRGEVMIGVTDLFDETDLPTAGIGSLTSHPTPGRALFVRLQLHF